MMAADGRRALLGRLVLCWHGAAASSGPGGQFRPACDTVSRLLLSVLSFAAGAVTFCCRGQADTGWGCGYRNIQMQASHLLLTSPQHRRSLFGGAGFIPDIRKRDFSYSQLDIVVLTAATCLN
jgi:hypothetical protein